MTCRMLTAGRRKVVLACTGWAAALEQVPLQLALSDPEAMSRCLRSAIRLLDLDGVLLPVDAGPLHSALADGSDPEEFPGVGPVPLLVESARRLRATLPDGTLIGPMLPGPATLACSISGGQALIGGIAPGDDALDLSCLALAKLAAAFAMAGCNLLVLHEDPVWQGALYPGSLARKVADFIRPVWNVTEYYQMAGVLQTIRPGSGHPDAGQDLLSVPDPLDLPPKRLAWQLPTDPAAALAGAGIPVDIRLILSGAELAPGFPAEVVRNLIRQLRVA